jgi:hypothetical protein
MSDAMPPGRLSIVPDQYTGSGSPSPSVVRPEIAPVGRSARRLAALALLVAFLSLIAGPARADVGFRFGPRIGVEAHDELDMFVGADVRLSFPLSPLTINPIFDYYFDERQRLFQVGVNALYHFPTSPIEPYVGVGVGVTAFSLKDAMPPAGEPAIVDDNGSRVGMNLIGGVCFDLPVVTAFVQSMVTVGEIDLVAIGGGLLFQLGGE